MSQFSKWTSALLMTLFIVAIGVGANVLTDFLGLSWLFDILDWCNQWMIHAII